MTQRPPVKQQRPVNLDLTTFKFPVTSISSILHRASGFIVFLAIPLFLYALDVSLESPQGYASIIGWGDSFFCKLIFGAMLGALFYHLVAGIRHLVMDFGFWEELESGQMSAKLTLIIGIGGGALICLIILFI